MLEVKPLPTPAAMSDLREGIARVDRLVGPYQLTRRLAPGPLGERYLALHPLEHGSHVIHRPSWVGTGNPTSGCTPFDAVMAGIDHLWATIASTSGGSHVLRVEDHGLDESNQPWVATPFTGDARGIVTLEDHLREKGGFLSPIEAREATIHLLQAAAAAHDAGFAHGRLEIESILVDRRGSLVIEFYGLERLLELERADAGKAAAPEMELLRRVEVRSIAEIAYRMVTGLLPEEPLIPAHRVVARLDPVWSDWLDIATDPRTGFRSAAHALSALADRSPWETISSARTVGVRSVLRRLLFAGA